jgi:hypothetical protein
MISLHVARDIHTALLVAKAVVEQRMATTPPSVRRYAHYTQLLTDYDNRLTSSEEIIKQLEEKIVIAESEENNIKLTIKEYNHDSNEPVKEAIYNVLLKSVV